MNLNLNDDREEQLILERDQELNVVIENSGDGYLQFDSEDNVDLVIDQGDSLELVMDNGGGESHHDIYNGPYTVYPDPSDIQIFQTNDKLMAQNVLAMPIPFFRTSNSSGGDTIYIGD